jgi:hypothetical protein
MIITICEVVVVVVAAAAIIIIIIIDSGCGGVGNGDDPAFVSPAFN